MRHDPDHHDHRPRFAHDEQAPHRHGGRHRDGAGGGPGGRPRGGPVGRSLGRFFAHGDLRLVILSLIAEKPRHGYEIIKEIEDRVAGAYSPSPGVIYPTLTLLEELGHVTVEPGEGAKKPHAITDAGRHFLAANRTTLDPVLARMQEAKLIQAAHPAPPVFRAMENLKLALRLRLERGPLSEADLRVVAAAIDTAATTIERS